MPPPRPGSAAIADHALLSNCQGSALVTTDGTVDWACLPRFDSPALFGALLGAEAGHWQLAPQGGGTAERRYLDGTMVLSTRWSTEGGEVEVWDLCPLGEHERGHGIGRHATPAIVRVVAGRSGTVRMAVEIAPRPEFGLLIPRIVERDGGAVFLGGASASVASGPVPFEVDTVGARLTAVVDVAAGDRVAFGLHVGDPWRTMPSPWSQSDLLGCADGTVEGWRSWSEMHQSYEGPYAEAVLHSGRVLQALTYAPSGAVVAAPTTSLPETIGGSRNWDYRYAWVRDASLTLEALWVAACPDEAHALFRFFATAAGTRLTNGEHLPIMYGIGGERHLPEVELDHLAGHRDSRPVRVGNDAWNQVQLDVYGEILAAACTLVEQLGELDEMAAAFLCDLADTASSRWREPDQGIWELRGEPQHHTYSKLMCWVAVDRAVRLADTIGASTEQVERWRRCGEEIRRTIVEEAWNEQLGAFTQTLGGDELDGSVLMLPIVGLLPADDPRMRSTIDTIAERLTDDRGFVYRYRAADGLDGDEGTFGICTFWLVHCWALLGEVGRARELCDAMLACANDVGLFPEQFDPATGEALGNFPQAFTHIGLINAAWAIHNAEQGARSHIA